MRCLCTSQSIRPSSAAPQPTDVRRDPGEGALRPRPDGCLHLRCKAWLHALDRLFHVRPKERRAGVAAYRRLPPPAHRLTARARTRTNKGPRRRACLQLWGATPCGVVRRVALPPIEDSPRMTRDALPTTEAEAALRLSNVSRPAQWRRRRESASRRPSRARSPRRRKQRDTRHQQTLRPRSARASSRAGVDPCGSPGERRGKVDDAMLSAFDAR